MCRLSEHKEDFENKECFFCGVKHSHGGAWDGCGVHGALAITVCGDCASHCLALAIDTLEDTNYNHKSAPYVASQKIEHLKLSLEKEFYKKEMLNLRNKMNKGELKK